MLLQIKTTITQVVFHSDSGKGAIATFVGAFFGHLTSDITIKCVTILVGLLTVVKLVLEIRRLTKQHKADAQN